MFIKKYICNWGYLAVECHFKTKPEFNKQSKKSKDKMKSQSKNSIFSFLSTQRQNLEKPKRIKPKVLFVLLLLILPIQILNAQQVDSENRTKELLKSLTKEEKAFLKSHPVIKVANQKAWPPFDFVENDIPTGYCIEHIQLLADKLGLKLEFVTDYKWVNLFELFKEKKIDIMPILYKNKQREPFTLFTEAYLKTTLSLYSVEDNTHLQSLDDLKGGIKVGIHQGDASIPYIKKKFPDIELIELAGSKEIIRALASRRVDAVIENSSIFYYNVKRYQVYNLKLVDFIETGNSNLEPSLHIGVRKDFPVLHSIIEKALHSVTEQEKQKLHEKWLGKMTSIHKELVLTEEEQAYLYQKKSIKLSVHPNWMPFEQIDETGKFKGISADIIQMISKSINKPIEIVPTETWTKTIENIQNKKCDIVTMIRSSTNRSKFMNFTKPYITEIVVVATKEDKFFIKESSDLKNRKIGVVEGSAFINLLKQKHLNIDIVTVKSVKEGLDKVKKDDLFGFVDVLPAIAYTIQSEGMINLKVAGRLEFDMQFCIASRKDEPLLNSIMQKALNRINEEQIKTIVGKWVAIKVEQSVNYQKLIYISLFFLTILSVIFFKNRSIKRINKELELAFLEKDKFFSIIAHDLKGPIGNLASILNTFKLNDIKDELYSHLRTSAQSTYELLLELLTWSRAQRKQLEIVPIDFNVRQALKKVISSLQLSADKKDIKLILQNENNAVYAYADIQMVNTVVRNLISNAIKFTKQGGAVSLKTELISNAIKVSVIDNGVGMTNEIISKLFNLGEHISSPGTLGERGTGLGLLLCKEFVNLNNGKIDVESQVGKGSTFWFTLPQGKQINDENIIDLIKEKQFKTLIIEDDFLNLQNTISELQKANIKYEVADNGEEGVEKGLEKQYDFILLDIDLPKKNGIEVNKNIRNKYPSAIIIALSSYGKSEIQDIDNHVVFNDYLKKPMQIDNLLDSLKKLKKI
jgi:ABC-type amino acid transport substrate-binding protein/CheY-like chemotaxis protein/anti-sigma regulatory factor (Ser/Thr protein kinase)